MGDLSRAIQIADGAGAILLELRKHAQSRGLSGRALKDAGDRAAHNYLLAALWQSHGQDAVLSEEAADNPERLERERVWIIDPLDGTREYSEYRDDWAVHVALWERGQLTAGAVALPGLHSIFSSVPREPANNWPAQGKLRFAVSRTRAHDSVLRAAEVLDAELLPMGSAGYKTCAVIRGEVDAYIHAGGQFEWDSAAPVAVARASGVHASRVDGSELAYNRADPYLPDLLVCRQEISQLLVDTMAHCTRPVSG